MINDEHDVVRPADEQRLAVEPKFTDLRVVEVHGHTLSRSDVVTSPQLAEAITGEGELSDQFDESRIVGIGADGFAEAGDQARGSSVPVREGASLGGVEEYVP